MPAEPMTAYCTEAELADVQANILDPLVSGEDYSAQLAEATRQIDRDLDLRWYRQAAAELEIDHRETPFDRDLLLSAATQLKRLGQLKGLQLVCGYLKSAVTDSAWRELEVLYAQQYAEELEQVLAAGLDYDWDENATIADEERATRAMPRRLVRM